MIKSIRLGGNLPEWRLKDPMEKKPLAKEQESRGMLALYDDENARESVEIYGYEKSEDTLDSFGQKRAAEHRVMCITTSVDGYASAVYNFYRGEDQSYVQEYIFEEDDRFLAVCAVYKTKEIDLAPSGYRMRISREYALKDVMEEEEKKVMEFIEFLKSLPTITISILDKQGEKRTLAQILGDELKRHDFIKAELICRNSLDAAFMGWLHGGELHAKALVDLGDYYLKIKADDPVSIFQHMVNAMIDSVEKK